MAMTIKEHIEAGHYPTDDKGRALVPTSKPGAVAIISDTDAGHCPNVALLGWIRAEAQSDNRIAWWKEDGKCFTDRIHLLPPPPRKVKVTAYCAPNWNGVKGNKGVWWRREDAPNNEPLIELTGEYEEPWS